MFIPYVKAWWYEGQSFVSIYRLLLKGKQMPIMTGMGLWKLISPDWNYW